MPTKRQTFPVEFRGGLITNISPLQQGINMPGSAITLKNFEPSIVGGYRRILGFSKFDPDKIPPYGLAVVNGAQSSGSTTLNIARTHTTPVAGDTFIIAGDTTTYTISSVEAFVAATNTTELRISPALASSPANAAVVTFKSYNTPYRTQGVEVFGDDVIVALNSDLYKTSGSGFTKVNVPAYGTVLVNSGSGVAQSATSLPVDGLTVAPQNGDMFTIAGIDKVYTVTADAGGTGAQTLTINPGLDSAASDNDAVTFISLNREGAGRTRFAEYNFTGTRKVAIVDGANPPALYDGTSFVELTGAPSDVLSATHVTAFKTHIFYGKGDVVSFTGPLLDSDFTSGNGGGNFRVGGNVTALIPFRESLIIFTDKTIQQITGSALSGSDPFVLKPISEDIGCIDGDTVQEIGGDVMFLTADGLRLLSATDRNNDFGLGIISKAVQSTLGDFIRSSSLFTSLTIRAKSQYRLFAFNPDQVGAAAKGIIATQFSPQGGTDFQFAEIRGMEVFSASSKMVGSNEIIVFSGDNGLLYKMEDGNSFDVSNIQAEYLSPYLPINDPRVRKTVYKANLFTDPQGAVNFDFNLKFDFDELNSVQPAAITFSNETSQIAFFGVNSFAKFSTRGSGTSDETTLTVADNTNMAFGNTITGTGIPSGTTITSTGTSNIGTTTTATAKVRAVTAKVNGSVSSSTNVTIDNIVGTILSGMTVTGSGISGTVTVAGVTDTNNIILSSAQSISDDVDLTFTGAFTTALVLDNNSGTIAVGMSVSGTDVKTNTFVTTVTDQNNIVLSKAHNLTDNLDLTFKNTAITISNALTQSISNVRITDAGSVFGGKVQNLFKTQTVGTGFTTAIQFRSNSTDPPFSLDTVTLEYGTNTRR